MQNVLLIKRTYENPNTGLCTSEIVSGYEMVRDFLLSRFLDPEKSIRGFRVNKAGNVTFKHGGGYDYIDMDLLGGDGDGAEKRRFKYVYRCGIHCR